MAIKRKRGRPPGSSPADRAGREERMLDLLTAHVMRHKRLPALAGIARIAGVSVATLVHYFGDRETVCARVLQRFGETGRRFYLPKAAEPSGPLEASIGDVCSYVADAMDGPVHSIHEFGLVEGLQSPLLAREYLGQVLDATLDAVAARITEHVRRGELRAANPRADALLLIGPVILAGLHQNALGGAATAKLDLHRTAAASAANYLSQKQLASKGRPRSK